MHCRLLEEWIQVPMPAGIGENADGVSFGGLFQLPPYNVNSVAAHPGTQQTQSNPGPLPAALKQQQNRRNGMALKHGPKQATPDKCIRECQPLRTLVCMALMELGVSSDRAETVAYECFGINFFLADSTAAQGYTWHTDCNDLADGPSGQYPREKLFGLRTCVVQLGDMDQTGMCVYNFAPHTYTGRGAAVWFHGSAPHRSMIVKAAFQHLQQPVWIVSLFFRPQDISRHC